MVTYQTKRLIITYPNTRRICSSCIMIGWFRRQSSRMCRRQLRMCASCSIGFGPVAQERLRRLDGLRKGEWSVFNRSL